MRKGRRGLRLYELIECYDNDGDELEMMRRAKLIRVSCHFFVSFRFFSLVFKTGEKKSEECAGANLLPSPTNRKNSNWN